jgi:hypothetical protein
MKFRLVVALAAGAMLIAVPAALAALSVTRAELSGGQLRVEGQDATPSATIAVDGVAMGTAGADGRFRVERSGFSSATCRIQVSDGTTTVETSLSGCTPSSSSPPPTSTRPTIAALTVSPSKIVGATTATATVTLSAAPAEPTTVAVWNDEGWRLWTPTSVIVSPPAKSASFAVATRETPGTFAANVGAGLNDTLAYAKVIVVPAAQTDIITITRAEQPEGSNQLKVEASSDNPNVTLSAYDSGGGFVGTLRNAGSGRYRGSFTVTSRVLVVEVRSNLGGCRGHTVNGYNTFYC